MYVCMFVCVCVYVCMLYVLPHSVEPLYNGHFRTRDFCTLLLQYRGFPLSEVKNVSVTPVGTKMFVLIMGVFLLCP